MAFALPPNETFRREDFFASPANAAALQALDCPRLLLIGPAGSGKTHLAHIWARQHQAQLGMPSLSSLQSDASVVIDNAQDMDQTDLFHLFNLLTPHGKLLLTAPLPPRDWATLPDVLSRLQTLPTATLEPPDDALLSAVLIKLFADRQITVAPNLIAYLTARMHRSIAAARALVAELDAKSLALARPITRAFAAEVLDTQFPLPFDQTS